MLSNRREFLPEDLSRLALAGAVRSRNRLRAALGEIWREAQTRRRNRRDLERLLEADERLLRDIGVDRWSLRTALSTGVLPPACTTAFGSRGDA